jgi:hypothetical protein
MELLFKFSVPAGRKDDMTIVTAKVLPNGRAGSA